KGLGLGLSISYNIVKDFGGSLTATNLAEGGAEFRIELPVADEQGQEAAE
ncbi:MAG: ATP-binding protein, partial [Ensifer adhaerens]